MLTRNQKIKILQDIAAGKKPIESLLPYKSMQVLIWTKPAGSDIIINSETGEQRVYNEERETEDFNVRVDRLSVIVHNSIVPLRTRETDVIEAMEQAGEIPRHYTPTLN